ncbi:MAG: hypothetical protein ACOC3Z_00320 [Nanoarchaeota archaeon]
MGLIKKGFFMIMSIFLFILFLSGNMFLTLSLSLEYETIKPELSSVITKLIKKENPDLENQITENKNELKNYCEEQDKIEYDYEGHEYIIPCTVVMKGENTTINYILENNTINQDSELKTKLTRGVKENYNSSLEYCSKNNYLNLTKENFNLNLPCELKDNSTKEIINYSLNEIVKNTYYKDYNCKGFKCFNKKGLPFFLVSKQMKDYYQSKFNLILILIIISIILLMFLSENKTNALIVSGVIMSLTSLPFSKIDSFFSLFSIKYFEFISVFVSQSTKVFWIFFIIGIIMIISGILIKIFNIEYKIAIGITSIINKFTKNKSETQ